MKRTYDFATIGFREIRDAFLGDDFVMVAEHETDKVVQFARLAEAPVLKLA